MTRRIIGGMRHDGAQAYFGRRAVAEDGRTYAEVTRDAVAEIVEGVVAGR